jgi:hypothetical protein
MVAGCTPQLAGTYRYSWQTRDDGAPFAWDGWFHGEITLEQAGELVTGDIGYPDEDPATLFGDPRLRTLWTWPLHGSSGHPTTIHAPAQYTAWDDSWMFVIDPDTLTGDAIPVAPSGPRPSGWSITLR